MTGSPTTTGPCLRGVLLALACAVWPPAGAGAAGSSEPQLLAFPLQQARRDQQRETTAAAPYRASLGWPLGEPAPGAGRHDWLSASAGVEFDQDVVLLSNAIGPPEEIDERDHLGGTWFVEGGIELFRRGRWSGGLLGSYWGAAYSDLDGFDTHFPSAGAWLDAGLGDRSALRLRWDSGYAWVDGKGYAESHHARPSIFVDWGSAGASEFFAEYYYYDFDVPLRDEPTPDGTGGPGMCSTPPSPEPCAPVGSRSEAGRKDRTGWGFVFGGEHRKQLAFHDAQLRGGYFYQHYIPDGAEFHNQSHQLWIGVRTALPLDLTFDAETSLFYQSSRSPSTYPDPDDLAPNLIYGRQDVRRHDVVWQASAIVGRPITSCVSASLEYAYTHRGSNYQVFEYDLHRLGAYLTVQLR